MTDARRDRVGSLQKPTCGFWKKVSLWLMQPPLRFCCGSSCFVQAPRSRASSHVLWMLR